MPSASPTSAPSRLFNFGGLMRESHPLGLIIFYVILFYWYRVFNEEVMREELNELEELEHELDEDMRAALDEEMEVLLQKEIEEMENQV